MLDMNTEVVLGGLMPTSTADLVTRLQAQQTVEYETQEALEAERRARTPDAQHFGPMLMASLAAFDPTWEEQQAFATQYRATNADADGQNQHGESGLGRALFQWRGEVATQRWQEVADRLLALPGCVICGQPAPRGEAITIGQGRIDVCSRCRPAVSAAHADAVAEEVVGQDGSTRRQAARRIVTALLEV